MNSLLGNSLYLFGFRLQAEYYNEGIPSSPVMKQIEFDLLKGQTSLTSFGATLGAIGTLNSIFSLAEMSIYKLKGEKSNAKNVFHALQYLTPVFFGLLNTYMEINQMNNPSYPDNWYIDIVGGWASSAIMLSTLVWYDLKNLKSNMNTNKNS